MEARSLFVIYRKEVGSPGEKAWEMGSTISWYQIRAVAARVVFVFWRLTLASGG